MTMTRPTTEQITHNGQLLKDVLGPVYNVMSFGAVGDGVTDDFDALIAAVNAVKAAGGGTVYIPATPNGYYLRRGATCELGGSSNISIVSDGATLKLQGGTISQAVPAVFGSTVAAGVQNLRISGLRFVAASTVLRYGNGPISPQHFDDEVNAGRADANEQTSFRYPINLAGACNGIFIENCYFGTGIFNPIGIKDGGYTPSVVVKNVQLRGLVFEGVNSQCMFLRTIKGLVISDITSLDHQGCKFDWTFYMDVGIENVSISNVCIKNSTYVSLFGASAFAFDGQTVNGTLTSTTIENIGMNGLILNSTNIAIAGLVIRSCGGGSFDSFHIGTLCENVTVTGLVVEDCPTSIALRGGENVSISDFVCRNGTRGIVAGVDDIVNCTVSDGQIIDCGSKVATPAACVGIANASVARAIKFANVDFIYETYAPGAGGTVAVDVRGANSSVTLTNCRFLSKFGTSAEPAVFAANGGRIVVDGCSQSGYPALTYSGATGAGVVAGIAELPRTEATLTVNSATPSVLGNALFVTANTSATAYTNFTDGVQGQDICVRVNDANTTFDFTGSSLKGNNGVDYAAASGDLVFAKRIGSNWYCTICEA
jgi:hypothetical protein